MKKLFLSLLPLLSFGAAAYFSEIKQIDGSEVLDDRTKYLVLDVRSKKEYNQGHIEGAINIPHTEIEKHLPELRKYADKQIVVHCRSGYRAGKAEDILSDNGFTNLLHLKGDMLQWQKDSLPLVKSAQ